MMWIRNAEFKQVDGTGNKKDVVVYALFAECSFVLSQTQPVEEAVHIVHKAAVGAAIQDNLAVTPKAPSKTSTRTPTSVISNFHGDDMVALTGLQLWSLRRIGIWRGRGRTGFVEIRPL